MAQRLCVSEEHGWSSCDSGCDVSEIAFREYQDNFDIVPLVSLIRDYWLKVNGEDLWHPIRVEGKSIYAAEAKLYQWKAERCNIQLALDNDAIVGFLLYHYAYNCVLLVEGIYVLPEYEKRGIGKKLIASIGKPIHLVLFQTHMKKNPPERFLSVLKGAKEIARKGDLQTWETKWL